MKLSAPTQPIWIISVVLGIAGILGNLGVIGALAGYSFWLVTVAFLLLALATMLKGL